MLHRGLRIFGIAVAILLSFGALQMVGGLLVLYGIYLFG